MRHPHINSSLARGNQQDPILILGHIARNPSCDSPIPVLLLAPDAQLFERELEVPSEGYLVRRLLVRLFPAHRWVSGG
jgi:hypothetical protein